MGRVNVVNLTARHASEPYLCISQVFLEPFLSTRCHDRLCREVMGKTDLVPALKFVAKWEVQVKGLTHVVMVERDNVVGTLTW